MTKEEFVLECQKIGVVIDSDILFKLNQYYNLLIRWNKKINLTSITSEKEVYLKHFYDSLCIVKVIDLNKIDSFCDIGTGAGFPGLVLKIVFPSLNVVLVDSLSKRINFLNEVIKELELTNIEAVHARAEEYVLLHRSSFDLVTARAVASLSVLMELCLPLVKNNNCFIAYKGSTIENFDNALKKLNSKLEKILEFDLPQNQGKRSLIKMRKINEISTKYPRRFDKIKKNPL